MEDTNFLDGYELIRKARKTCAWLNFAHPADDEDLPYDFLSKTNVSWIGFIHSEDSRYDSITPEELEPLVENVSVQELLDKKLEIIDHSKNKMMYYHDLSRLSSLLSAKLMQVIQQKTQGIQQKYSDIQQKDSEIRNLKQELVNVRAYYSRVTASQDERIKELEDENSENAENASKIGLQDEQIKKLNNALGLRDKTIQDLKNQMSEIIRQKDKQLEELTQNKNRIINAQKLEIDNLKAGALDLKDIIKKLSLINRKDVLKVYSCNLENDYKSLTDLSEKSGVERPTVNRCIYDLLKYGLPGVKHRYVKTETFHGIPTKTSQPRNI